MSTTPSQSVTDLEQELQKARHDLDTARISFHCAKEARAARYHEHSESLASRGDRLAAEEIQRRLMAVRKSYESINAVEKMRVDSLEDQVDRLKEELKMNMAKRQEIRNARRFWEELLSQKLAEGQNQEGPTSG